MAEKQRTIKSEVTISGTGLHTGHKVKMTFKPAPANHHYKFKRTDLPEQPEVAALVENVVDVSRGTTIEKNGARVSTVEHTLAALVGLQIDNVLIEVDGPETPIMDGSSRQIIEALESAGFEELAADRIYADLGSVVSFDDQSRKVELHALPSDVYQVQVMIDYESTVLGSQHARVDTINDFKNEIAASRTFCFLHEIQEMYDNNLIRGGDLDNAIVLVDHQVTDDEITHLKHLFNKEDVKIRPHIGMLNNVDLRFENEPARHKLLDVIGDLALVGYPIKAKIIASRPGHAANIEFAKKIKAHIDKRMKAKDVPMYDVNQEPVYDIKMIEKSLPHKYPFLLVDKIMEISDKHVIGIKNVTYNEPFFTGHFPGNPVMPGVLQIEAMAQTGGILVLNQVEDPEGYETYFLKIDKAKFKRKVVPGDTLIFKLELLSPIRRGICEMRGKAYVGDQLVSEAELVAQVVKKKTES